MPKPASRPDPVAEAPDAAASIPEAAARPVAGGTRWRYRGPRGRIYTHIPVTPQPGDVIAWPEIPAGDGAWEPTGDDVTRMPDNWAPGRYDLAAAPAGEGGESGD